MPEDTGDREPRTYPQSRDYEYLIVVRDVGHRPSVYCLICRRADLCEDASLVAIGRALRNHVCVVNGG